MFVLEVCHYIKDLLLYTSNRIQGEEFQLAYFILKVQV